MNNPSRSVAGRNTVRFPLSLAACMHDKIKRIAGKNKRTMNSEILARLEGYDALQAELERYRYLVDECLVTRDSAPGEVTSHG